MEVTCTRVLLMNEDRSLQLVVGFFGYSQKAVEKYLTEKFIECDKAYAKRWAKMKYI